MIKLIIFSHIILYFTLPVFHVNTFIDLLIKVGINIFPWVCYGIEKIGQNLNKHIEPDNVINIEDILQEELIETDERSYSIIDYSKIFKPTKIKYDSESYVNQQAQIIIQTYKQFKVKLSLQNIIKGISNNTFYFLIESEKKLISGEEIITKPSVTKVSNKIDDLAINLGGLSGITFQDKVDKQPWISFTIPSEVSNIVTLGNAIQDISFTKMLNNRNKYGHLLSLPVALGYGVNSELITLDITESLHILIGAATGQGKSSCMNTIILSLIMGHTPKTLELDLIDPKLVEFDFYSKLPHVRRLETDTMESISLISSYIDEIARRYNLLKSKGVKNIQGYNSKITSIEQFMPFRVLIIDEYAELINSLSTNTEKKRELEITINRITALARACGIYLILSTQRPEVQIITGQIKANIPTRIAFKTTNALDSRTILDTGDAEKLLGAGDGLIRPTGSATLVRFKGLYANDNQIKRVVREWRKR